MDNKYKISLQVFSMNSSTGVVNLVNLHSFDQTSSYLLNISVSDGVHASITKLRVNLVSANSYAPTFGPKSVFEVNFAENQAKGVQVARMTAVDNDRNDHVRYSIPSEILSSGLFQLDQDTGEVWSAAAFDREEKDRYDIPVTATDRNGKSGFSVLKVRIIDVNDNAPAFDLVIIIVLNSITSNKLFISIK